MLYHKQNHNYLPIQDKTNPLRKPALQFIDWSREGKFLYVLIVCVNTSQLYTVIKLIIIRLGNSLVNVSIKLGKLIDNITLE